MAFKLLDIVVGKNTRYNDDRWRGREASSNTKDVENRQGVKRATKDVEVGDGVSLYSKHGGEGNGGGEGTSEVMMKSVYDGYNNNLPVPYEMMAEAGRDPNYEESLNGLGDHTIVGGVHIENSIGPEQRADAAGQTSDGLGGSRRPPGDRFAEPPLSLDERMQTDETSLFSLTALAGRPPQVNSNALSNYAFEQCRIEILQMRYEMAQHELQKVDNVMFRPEDVVFSLQLLAYITKYARLRNILYNQKRQDEVSSVDDEMVPRGCNVFSLIEKLTFLPNPQCIRDWAAVVMKNVCRKDETKNGLRRCSYLKCMRWESPNRLFSKCRRCRRAKYCSRLCQSEAWAAGHKNWCSERPNPSADSCNYDPPAYDSISTVPFDSPNPASDNSTTSSFLHSNRRYSSSSSSFSNNPNRNFQNVQLQRRPARLSSSVSHTPYPPPRRLASSQLPPSSTSSHENTAPTHLSSNNHYSVLSLPPIRLNPSLLPPISSTSSTSFNPPNNTSYYNTHPLYFSNSNNTSSQLIPKFTSFFIFFVYQT
ncbi:MYND-type zinc finger protein samB [Zancudomyces culisetae]|uniref:MYND-type zinc finger protein samB n=1 Tax=Zancudomyces culisetae TaxID=1213189 RepID=A0A1R1PT45_ZANCU|nr:MYND-type zinc finger protein samB [Zancudomyces culisetae]|eukprot:OMH84062.1 MYND-type zinc finger protein samB [Zancudomyces culisetae]